MTDHANPAAATGHSTWIDQAINAYDHEQSARQRRHIECAAPDIAALQTKLAELGITPIDEPYDRPYQVTADGTVTALIARPDYSSDDPAEYWRCTVFACARAGRLWLRAATPDDAVACDVVGELHSLADVGRALIEGPQSPLTPATHYDQAERRLRTSWPDCSTDASVICQALDGLTHAVLAVADGLRDTAFAAGTVEGGTGGER